MFVSLQFQSGQAEQSAKGRGDPESHDDLAFRPALKLEMVVQGGAEKDPPPPPFVAGHLKDDAAGLGDEDPAHDQQQQFCRAIAAKSPSSPPKGIAPVLPMKTWAG